MTTHFIGNVRGKPGKDGVTGSIIHSIIAVADIPTEAQAGIDQVLNVGNNEIVFQDQLGQYILPVGAIAVLISGFWDTQKVWVIDVHSIIDFKQAALQESKDYTDDQIAIERETHIENLAAHTGNKNNPHAVTKAQVGLENVDNTPDANKSVLSAEKLTTARKINNADFDGTKNIGVSNTFVRGTQTASTNVFTGAMPHLTLADLVEGFTIRYSLPFSGTSTSATLTLTMSDGVTPPVPLYFRIGSRLTTQMASNSNFTLTYFPNGFGTVSGPLWICDHAYYVDTTSITHVYGALSNQYRTRAATAGWSPGNETRYPLIGVTDNGTVDKITATSSSNAAGVRQFTPNRISLFDNIFINTTTTSVWPTNGILSQALFSRTNVGIDNWRFAIGQYYNIAGVLTGNNVITDLNQVPLYVGGTKDGNYFVPKEFSVSLPATPRAGIDIYKLIGYFTSAAANMYLTDYQTVYQYRNDQWVTLEALADGAVQKNELPYTYIVDSDAKLAAWANNTAGNDYSCVLIKKGTWTYQPNINNAGTPENPFGILNLSLTGTKSIVGEIDSFIVIKPIFTDTAELYVAAIKGNGAFDTYFDKVNILINFYPSIGTIPGTASVTGYGFFSCNNIYNCTANGRGNPGGIGFGYCNNIYNSDGLGHTSANGTGFIYCKNLFTCRGRGTRSNQYGSGTAFMYCEKLFACELLPGTGSTGPTYNMCITGFANKNTNGVPLCFMEQQTFDPSQGVFPSGNAWANTAAGGYNN